MDSSTTRVEAGPIPAPSARTHSLVGTLATALLGAVIIWVVGFSHAQAVHNAAHDTRHSHAFPCH